jgi:hypothetical protein
MFQLPPFETEAIVVLLSVGISLMLGARIANGSGGVLKTVSAALLLALVATGFFIVCVGSLCSASFRNWLYESPQAAEESALGLLVGSGISALFIAHLLYHAWELFQ